MLKSFMIFHVHCHAFSTFPIILSAISHFHSKHFMTSPTTSRLITRSLEGAKRLFGSPSTPPKIITKDILRSLITLSFNASVSFVTFWTVWCIAMEFYGLLRFSEVSNLQFSDLRWTDLGFDIFIRLSKTDQTGKGDWVANARQPDSPFCPVTLSERYLSLLGYTTGFIMPAIKHSRPDPSTPLSYNTALCDLQSVFCLINLDPTGYGKHSSCRGGTTAAASKGSTIDELMIQGRWRYESLPRLYTDNALKCKRKFAKRLAQL